MLVIKDGEIIERGTHTSLLAAGSFYQHLYQGQFRGHEVQPDPTVLAAG